MAASFANTRDGFNSYVAIIEHVLSILRELNVKDWSDARSNLILEGAELTTLNAVTISNDTGTRTAGDEAMATAQMVEAIAIMKSYATGIMTVEEFLRTKDWVKAKLAIDQLITVRDSGNGTLETVRSTSGSTTGNGAGRAAVVASVLNVEGSINRILVVLEARVLKQYKKAEFLIEDLAVEVENLKTNAASIIELS